MPRCKSDITIFASVDLSRCMMACCNMYIQFCFSLKFATAWITLISNQFRVKLLIMTCSLFRISKQQLALFSFSVFARVCPQTSFQGIVDFLTLNDFWSLMHLVTMHKKLLLLTEWQWTLVTFIYRVLKILNWFGYVVRKFLLARNNFFPKFLIAGSYYFNAVKLFIMNIKKRLIWKFKQNITFFTIISMSIWNMLWQILISFKFFHAI